MHRDGYKIPIEKLKELGNVVAFNLNDHKAESSKISKFFNFPAPLELIKIKTESGRELICTEDHLIFTLDGIKCAKELKENDKVIIYPFEGVEYEEKNDVILEEKDFEKNIANELKKRNLLPLTCNHSKIGIIARLFGYILGDGYVYKTREKRKGRKKLRERFITVINGKEEDLKQLMSEISELGFKASRIYKRKRKIKIKTAYKEYEIKNEETFIRITSKTFSLLLVKLGMPIGEKTTQQFEVPKWILNAPKWIKRNFLAGLFGAELTKPLTITNHPYTFQQPQLTIGKLKGLKENAIKFLEQIKNLLKEFDIKCSGIYEIPSTEKTIGLRLVISNEDKNLINLFGKIGYEYNKERQHLACLAVEYLKLKQNFKNELKVRTRKINFPTFEEFRKDMESKLLKSGLTFEKVVKIEKIKRVSERVYDIRVKHKDHNFIANNFLVSNCGVRVLTTKLTYDEIKNKIKDLLDEIFKNVPAGVGEEGKIKLSFNQLDEVLQYGAKWAVNQGYGNEKDLEFIESNGCMPYADPDCVSNEAKRRGAPQLGTLGSGNHFLEIQVVNKIFHPEEAKIMGIEKVGQVVVMIHTGSRGLGHQVASDYLRFFEKTFRDILRTLPDRELIYAPAKTREAENYFKAMCAAANYAFANRQMITHWVRESFEKVLKMKIEDIGLETVYDVAHNIAKIEEHEIDGKKVKVYVHRKGATRAFPIGSKEIPKKYEKIGQPILIPGSMGTPSYILLPDENAKETFYSAPHGSGRVQSRAAAVRTESAHSVIKRLEEKGILVKAASYKGIAEERPEAYKYSPDVIEATELAKIAKAIVEFKPIAVMKG